MFSVGDRLKKARIYRGKGVKDLAAHLGISERAYRNYENGERDIGTKRLKQVSDYLNVSANYILGLTDDLGLSEHIDEAEVEKEIAESIAKEQEMELVAESSDERRKIRMKELQEEENSNIEYIIKLFENLTLIQQSIIIDYAELFIEENYRNTLKKRAQFKRMQNEQKMSRKMNNEGSDESDN